MKVVASSGMDSIFQLITVIFIFVFVLAITYFTTRWIVNYQKGLNLNQNIDLLETYKITVNKFLQIVKVGNKYILIAVCKDTITMLTEIPEDEIKHFEKSEVKTLNFKEILEKAKNLKNKK